MNHFIHRSSYPVIPVALDQGKSSSDHHIALESNLYSDLQTEGPPVIRGFLKATQPFSQNRLILRYTLCVEMLLP